MAYDSFLLAPPCFECQSPSLSETRLKPKLCLPASAMLPSCLDLFWMGGTLPLQAVYLVHCGALVKQSKRTKSFRR